MYNLFALVDMTGSEREPPPPSSPIPPLPPLPPSSPPLPPLPSPPPPSPSPPSPPPQPQLSQRAARELGAYNPGPEDGDVQRSRTRAETARHRGGADVEMGQDQGGDCAAPGGCRCGEGEDQGGDCAAPWRCGAWAAVVDGSAGGYRPYTLPPCPAARKPPLYPHARRARFRRRTRMLKRVRMSTRSSGSKRWLTSIVDWRTRGLSARYSNQAG